MRTKAFDWVASHVDGPGGRRIVSRTDFTEALEMRKLLGTGGPL